MPRTKAAPTKSSEYGRAWNDGTDACRDLLARAAIANAERPAGTDWEWVPRRAIEVKRDLSPRSKGVILDVVRRYRDVVDLLPPMVVQRDTWRLIDGFHRYDANDLHDLVRVVEQDVADDDMADEAFLANVRHGEPLSPADRYNAGRAFYLRHRDWSPVRIAEAVSVHQQTVRNWADKLTGSASAPTDEELGIVAKFGKDNKLRPANRPKSTKPKANTTAPSEPADPLATAMEEAEQVAADADRAGDIAGKPSAPELQDWFDWDKLLASIRYVSSESPLEFVPKLFPFRRKALPDYIDMLRNWVADADTAMAAGPAAPETASTQPTLSLDDRAPDYGQSDCDECATGDCAFHGD